MSSGAGLTFLFSWTATQLSQRLEGIAHPLPRFRGHLCHRRMPCLKVHVRIGVSLDLFLSFSFKEIS